jgi:hypothetical protein
MSGARTDTSHQTYKPSGDISILALYLTRKRNELRPKQADIHIEDNLS